MNPTPSHDLPAEPQPYLDDLTPAEVACSPKRYDICVSTKEPSPYAAPYPSTYGDWVSYADYELLEDRCRELEGVIRRVIEMERSAAELRKPTGGKVGQ